MQLIRADFSNGSISFREHKEHMKTFCKSHANIAMANAVQSGVRFVPDNTLFLQLIHIVRAKGGLKLPISAEEWLAIVPMWNMATREFFQN